MELRAAVAAEAAEDVAGKALGVGPQQHWFGGIDLTQRKRQVVLAPNPSIEGTPSFPRFS